jgi:hypothetical protein
MEQRRSIPWLWVLGTLGLIVVVGAIAYYLGANHAAGGQPMVFARPIGFTRFGHGAFGFWLFVLVVAIVVGVVVAAIARPRRPAVTLEEWHRGAHAAEVAGPHAHPAQLAEAGEDTVSSGSADPSSSSGSSGSSA